MEKFTPQKIDLAAINEGNRYGYEGIQPDAINRPIEASAYAQEIAESVKGLALNQPDSSQADIVGTPTVEISGIGENAKFVFKGLKGERGLTGPSGVASGTVNSNAEGTSDTDGYTQQAVNKIASRPNLIINSNFSINQRGQTSYSGSDIDTVDRWRTYNNITLNVVAKTVTNNETNSQAFFIQDNENFNSLYGKTVTISCLIDNVKYSATATLALSYQSIQVIAQTGTTNTKFELSYNPTRGILVQFRLNAGTSAVIDECKLEIGNVATTYTAPIYEEEIWKCNAVYGEPVPLSNPNLLINPDFLINQRGQMSYGGGKYGVDRWIFASGTTAEIQESGALKLKRTASGNCCLQRIEDWKKLVGKTVTLSVKFSQITAGTVKCNIYTGTTFTGTPVSTSGSVSTVTVTIPENATKVECFIYANNACEVVPEYAKLEIGSVATAFTKPLIAEELPKCQRYYRIVYGFKRAVDGYDFYEPFQAFYGPMRISPTIAHQYSVSPNGVIGTTENGLYDITSNSEINVSVNQRGYINEYGCIIQNGDGKFTADHMYRYVLYVDAEIY